MSDGNTDAVLLTLPRELRDGIYGYLLLDQHEFVSSPKPTANPPITDSIHRKNATTKAYIDSRIYMPVRPAPNVLGICRQLRAEYLDYINHFLSSQSTPMPIAEPEVAGAGENAVPGTSEFKAKEQSAERARDDGSLRITIEIMRPIMGGIGSYVPQRDQPSPRFVAMAPLFGKLRKVKINVWAGWDWWFGPPQIRRLVRKGIPISNGGEGGDDGESEPRKPDPLAVAISTMLSYLPSVEEVDIEVMLHGWEYCNMDLPENRWEYVQGWLENPVDFQNGRTMTKLNRRMVVIDLSQDPFRAATFYHKMETWEAKASGESKNVIHVAEGHRVISEDDFFNLSSELAFTREYDRFE